MCNRLMLRVNDGERKSACCNKEKFIPLSEGSHFTRLSEEDLLVAQKGFVPSHAACGNKWTLNNFKLWRFK